MESILDMNKESIIDTDKELKSILDFIINKIESIEKELTKRQPLTDKQRLEIIKSNEPIPELAIKYHRSRQQIHNIRNKVK
jgi:hypothetical protein